MSVIRDRIAVLYDDPGLLFVDDDDMDLAIVGVADLDEISVVVYSIPKILEVLETRDGMSRDDARDYFYFNVQSAYVGDHTPIFIHPIEITVEE